MRKKLETLQTLKTKLQRILDNPEPESLEVRLGLQNLLYMAGQYNVFPKFLPKYAKETWKVRWHSGWHVHYQSQDGFWLVLEIAGNTAQLVCRLEQLLHKGLQEEYRKQSNNSQTK